MEEFSFPIKPHHFNEITPNYNVSAGNLAPVITMDAEAKINIKPMCFGFTPSWAKKQMYLINARSEGDNNKENSTKYNGALGIIKKSSFRSAIRSQRCIVLANGYYEGPQKEKLSKPYYIYSPTKNLLQMAGIWNTWVDNETGEEVHSFAIITTFANRINQTIGHHRSPVLLNKSQNQDWINIKTPLQNVLAMLKPSEEKLLAHPVAITVKNPQNNGIKLIDPVGELIRIGHNYKLQTQLDLEGMGMTRARKRKIN